MADENASRTDQAEGYDPAADVQSNDAPDGWMVDFDLPYFVSVRDSMDDPVLRAFTEALEAGETPEPVPYSPRLRSGAVVLGGPPLHLPDLENLAVPFDVPQEPGEARISFLKRIRNVDRSVAAAGELRPDRGALSYSSVMIQFNDALSSRFETNDLAGVAGTALEVVNKFLKQYRRTTGAFWAHAVDKYDVMEFRVLRLYRNAMPKPGLHTAPRGGPLRVGQPPLVDTDTDADLRRGLVTDLEMSVPLQLLQSAQEHSNRRRYRSAIIDAAGAFEVCLAVLIRSHLAGLGKSDEEIEAVFLRDSGGYVGVGDLAKGVLRDWTEIDFAGTTEYRDWRVNVADVRNAVIHSDSEPSHQSALDAIRDAGKARVKLLELAESVFGP